MNPPLGEKSKAAILSSIGFLVAALIGIEIGMSDYWPLIFAALGLAGLFIWFGTGQWFWLITIASSYLGGTFPVLRGAFTPFQLLMAVGVAKFFIEDVILRRVSFQRTDRSLLFLTVGFMAVLTIHALHDRLGMRFLGSTVWGGHNYVNVYVGLVAFFVIQSVTIKATLWNKLPYLIIGVTCFDLAIGALTLIIPSAIYYIYPFYSAVSSSGVTELITGHEDVTGRLGAFGNFGCVLAAVIVSTTSVRQLLGGGAFFRWVGLCFSSLAVIFSGYRSAVANLAFTFLTAGYRDLRFRIVAVVPLLVAFLFGLSAINSSVVRLPKQMQRALAFMPGDWDAQMASDAASSNDFRVSVWTLWWRQYFPQHPLFGRGFGFRSEWADDAGGNHAVDYVQMVETGNIHNGLFASLDAIGVIGTIFFVLWNLRLLLMISRVRFDRSDPTGFALRFLALQLAVSILSYWVGAVTLGTFLPTQFALAGLFLRLNRPRRKSLLSSTSAPEPVENVHLVARSV